MSDKKDSAGPLLGWSIGTGLDGKDLSEVLKLPSDYKFKVIGEASDIYVRDLRTVVEEIIGRQLKESEVELKTSSNNKYVSITFTLFMDKVETIHAIYAALRANESTRFLL